jgi:ribosome-associated protein
LTTEPESIRLDQFLKLQGVTGTGGQAKWLIQDGQILVNGDPETRRRRKLVTGDVVEVGDLRMVVEFLTDDG